MDEDAGDIHDPTKKKKNWKLQVPTKENFGVPVTVNL
jgi:hypothetical protein